MLEMWIILITFILHLITVTFVVVSSLGCCCKAKTEKTQTEKSLPSKTLSSKSGKETPAEAAEKAKLSQSSHGGERTDIGASLGSDNPELQAIISEPPGEEVSDNYLETLEKVLETASNFTWGMKKHMAADEAAWKELAKRITLLKTEGYDVRAGTKEAKRRRLASVNQSSLMEKVTKKRKKRADAGDGD
ncbi:hypothetical protein V3C99_007065 [Haemonchus contortus]